MTDPMLLPLLLLLAPSPVLIPVLFAILWPEEPLIKPELRRALDDPERRGLVWEAWCRRVSRRGR